jgi:hypothetical protein
MDATIQNLARQNAAFARNTKFLLAKIVGVAELLSGVLALRNQRIGQVQGSHLFSLAKTSHLMTHLMLRDSATVRVITTATLVFLPTTLVAVSGMLFSSSRGRCLTTTVLLQTLFGTQLFYLTPSHSLGVSPHIWVIFAIAIPLTAVTMVWWVVRKRKHESQRKALYESI